MIPSRRRGEHEPSLIEDVVMPHAERYSNPDREEVRRRSIGNLQQQYLRTRKRSKSIAVGDGATPSFAAKIWPKRRYDVVPPLGMIRSSGDSLPGLSMASLLVLSAPIGLAKFIGERLAKIRLAIVGAFAGLFAVFTKRLPKRYSAAAGTSTDWKSTLWGARYIVPVVLILFILSLLLVGVGREPTHHANQGPSKSGNAARIPVVQGNFTAGNTSGKSANSRTSSSSSPQPQASSSVSPSTSLGLNTVSSGGSSSGGSSGTGGITGGRGGGPGGGGTPIPNCTLNQVATATCYVPACTPEVTLSPGQKAILGVDGTCVIVN